MVTEHIVYFCAFARSEIFQNNAGKSGVSRGKFDAGVNGLTEKLPKHKLSHCLAALSPPQKIGR